ncbi:DUF732 domain-containing protein [Nocardia cyriacigeorgica]|uniref:DUF732 domain-containing protein n=1 Tax=Nocardia cyriacigeorgica TaxID=135487 RepID=A0A5R8N9R6_9NOCA|nr:DUF732 domain-containing protein [Nocardia cyriacigeorgica]MBF6094993.1 DUF732 domain-containing protein [Nocardia cyriacigeorgica]MBF6427878.1 DUF732 domain-containing protein [Nocardia cyriacigeorgica]TLF72455.1 DUF732 domain-containing protein [Nocardia cyriacigeorgica]
MMNRHPIYRPLCVVALNVIALVAFAVGCGDGSDTQSSDERFDKAVSEQNLDIDPDQAQLQAKNSCADLDASTDDPANLDPFEVARIVQKVQIKTKLSQDDAGLLVALGIEAYCPEFKASFGK